MSNLDTYPLITVKRLGESRDFFVKYFGMSLVFEASWVVMLARKEGGPIVLGLMTADHPSNPPGPETFDGRGMILTFQVEDAAAEHSAAAGRHGRADYLRAGGGALGTEALHGARPLRHPGRRCRANRAGGGFLGKVHAD